MDKDILVESEYQKRLCYTCPKKVEKKKKKGRKKLKRYYSEHQLIYLLNKINFNIL